MTESGVNRREKFYGSVNKYTDSVQGAVNFEVMLRPENRKAAELLGGTSGRMSSRLGGANFGLVLAEVYKKVERNVSALAGFRNQNAGPTVSGPKKPVSTVPATGAVDGDNDL